MGNNKNLKKCLSRCLSKIYALITSINSDNKGEPNFASLAQDLEYFYSTSSSFISKDQGKFDFS